MSDVDAVEVEAKFQKFAEWMIEFYSEPNEGLDNVVSALFTKAKELVDPTDPSKSFTGNVLFTINERLKSVESIQRHVESVSQNITLKSSEKFLGLREK